MRGVGIDCSDWDAVMAVQLSVSGSRAERRAAERWLKGHQQEHKAALTLGAVDREATEK